MNRSDNEKLTSWYLSLIFSGATPEEAAAVIAEVRAELEAVTVPVSGG